jgi:hypothetical protein
VEDKSQTRRKKDEDYNVLTSQGGSYIMCNAKNFKKPSQMAPA